MRLELLVCGRQLRPQQLDCFFGKRHTRNRVNVSLNATKVFSRKLWLFTKQIQYPASAIRLGPRVRQKIRIVSADDALVGRDDDSRRRIVKRRQLRHRDVAGPLARVSRSVVRHTPVTRLPDWYHTGSVIADMPVDVSVNDVLRRRGKRLERGIEIFPVARAIDDES